MNMEKSTSNMKESSKSKKVLNSLRESSTSLGESRRILSVPPIIWNNSGRNFKNLDTPLRALMKSGKVTKSLQRCLKNQRVLYRSLSPFTEFWTSLRDSLALKCHNKVYRGKWFGLGFRIRILDSVLDSLPFLVVLSNYSITLSLYGSMASESFLQGYTNLSQQAKKQKKKKEKVRLPLPTLFIRLLFLFSTIFYDVLIFGTYNTLHV